jgi:hypothetical protein
LPKDVRFRILFGINTTSMDLNSQWRKMHADGLGGTVPPSVLGAYLRTLRWLLTRGTSKYYRTNRRRLIEEGGLLALKLAVSSPYDSVRCAGDEVLLELSREPTLLDPLLAGLMVGAVVPKLDLQARTKEEVLRVLQILDAMAMSAQRYTARMVWEKDGDLTFAGEGAYEEDPNSAPRGKRRPRGEEPELLQDELWRKTRKTVLSLMEKELTTVPVIDKVLGSLESECPEVFLRALLTLHKMACTPGYGLVLDRILLMGGRALETALRAVTAPQPELVSAATTLFRQLASTVDGREVMANKGAVAIVRPLCESPEASDSMPFLAGMRCLVSLCHVAQPTHVPPQTVQLQLSVKDTRDLLYDELYVVTAAEDTRLESAALMRKRGVSPILLRYLVRFGSEPFHPFYRDRTTVVLSALLGDRLIMIDVQKSQLKRMLDYLFKVIELNIIAAVDHTTGPMTYEGLTAAFLTVCKLVDHAPRARHEAWGEAPRSRLFSNMRVLLAEYTAGRLLKRRTLDPKGFAMKALDACLLTMHSLAPLPVYETLPFIKLEPPMDYEGQEMGCLPELTELCRVFLPDLLALVKSCNPVAEAALLSSSCHVLTKLATTYFTCEILTDHGVLDVLEGLLPKGPALLEGPDADAVSRLSSAVNMEALRILPASFFTLLASLARIVGLRQTLHQRLFLTRAVERLHIPPMETNQEALPGIFLFLARMAHICTADHGQSNDLLLSPRFRVVSIIVDALEDAPHVKPETRYAAATAAASMLRDTLKAIPCFIKAGLITRLEALARNPDTPHPLLRRLLECMAMMASHPNKEFHEHLERANVRHCLFRISNSKECCKHIKGRINLSDLASEVLLYLDKKTVARKQKSRPKSPAITSETAHSKKTLITFETEPPHPKKALGPTVPAHRLPIPRGGIMDYGVSACGSLQKGEVVPGHWPPEHPPKKSKEQRERWRERYLELTRAQFTASWLTTPTPPKLEEMSAEDLRKTRPPAVRRQQPVDDGEGHHGGPGGGQDAAQGPQPSDGLGSPEPLITIKKAPLGEVVDPSSSHLLLDTVFSETDRTAIKGRRNSDVAYRPDWPGPQHQRFVHADFVGGHLVYVKSWRARGPPCKGAGALEVGELVGDEIHSLNNVHEYISTRQVARLHGELPP